MKIGQGIQGKVREMDWQSGKFTTAAKNFIFNTVLRKFFVTNLPF